MKVKYIYEPIQENDGLEVNSEKYINDEKIIKGNIYECIGKKDDYYKIIDETKHESLYPIEDFEIIEGGNFFKVALMQIYPCGSLFENLQKGIGFCRKAKAMGADVALFPEMWSNGYNIPEDVNQLKKQAIAKDSAFLRSFLHISRNASCS